MNDIMQACKDYGTEVSYNDHSFTIKFKDGKTLVYAMNNCGKDINKICMNLDKLIKSVHGRIFNKDGRFVNYLPKSENIHQALINADLILDN